MKNIYKLEVNVLRIFVIHFLVTINTVQSELRQEIHSESIITLKTAIREFVQSTATHDIGLITHNSRQNNWTQEINNGIRDGAAGIVPMYSLMSEELNSYFLEPLFQLTTRSLLIYTETDLQRPMGEILENMMAVSVARDLPKVLLVYIREDEDTWNGKATFESMLIYVRFLNINLLEIIRHGEKVDVSMILHQYDHRTKDYTNRSFIEKASNWYPDKNSDLLGSNFYLKFGNHYPLGTWMVANNCTYVLSGVSGEVINTLREVINFKLTACNKEYCDMDFLCAPHTHIPEYNNLESTVPIEMERLCLIIPRMYVERRSVTPWRFAVAVCVGVLITVIFWLPSMLMKSLRKLTPRNTIALMLGQGMTREPKTLVEKIMFVSLVISATRYTAMFYTELFDLAVVKDIELNVANFEELEKSGLHAFIQTHLYEDVLSENEEISSVSKEDN